MTKPKTREEHIALIAKQAAKGRAQLETPRDLLRTFRLAGRPKAVPVPTGNGGPRLSSNAEEAVALAKMLFGRRYRTELAGILGVSPRMVQHYEKGRSALQDHELAHFRRVAIRHWERLGAMLGIAL